MNHEENFYLKVAGAEIKISELQHEHLSLIAFNSRMETETHIKKRYQMYTDGETEITDTTISFTEGDLLSIFKDYFE